MFFGGSREGVEALPYSGCSVNTPGCSRKIGAFCAGGRFVWTCKIVYKVIQDMVYSFQYNKGIKSAGS